MIQSQRVELGGGRNSTRIAAGVLLAAGVASVAAAAAVALFRRDEEARMSDLWRDGGLPPGPAPDVQPVPLLDPDPYHASLRGADVEPARVA